MTLTKDDQAVLKALVERELKEIKEQGENFPFDNSPVLSSIYRMRETDIPFIKTKALYQDFLEKLLRKINQD